MVGFRFRMRDPWRELRQTQREMDRMFESVFRGRETPYPACNVWSGDDDLLVTCELPGVSMDDLAISVMGDTLTISGERKPTENVPESAYHRRERGARSFDRSLQLPARVDAGKVDANFKDGVLSIRLGRAAEARPRRIEIKSA